MTIEILTRAAKGDLLDNGEVDQNFLNLKAGVEAKLDASAYTAADALDKVKTVDGTGSGLDADLLDGLHASALALADHGHPLPSYVTTTTAAEGYFRIATVPIAEANKVCTFRLHAVTPSGTTTEAVVQIALGYSAAQSGSQQTSIATNTSHSYSSNVNSENGWVLQYLRVSFDTNYAYIDVWNRKLSVVTMTVTPLHENNWTWATGALSINPAVGATRNTVATFNAGLSANTGSVSSAGYATYSNYGVFGTQTPSNTTNKQGQWAYLGYVQFDYNSSYLRGRSINVGIRMQEVCFDGSVAPADLDDFRLRIRANLGYHADANAFAALASAFDLTVEGKTSLTSADFAAVCDTSSTSLKYIKLYVKLKAPNTQYAINPEQRYGRAYATTSYAETTSYAIFTYVSNTVVAALPSPVAGTSVVNASLVGYLSEADRAKFDGIEAGAQVNTVTSVAGKTGAVTLAKGDVGLGSVDNTSDANKPISTATQAALDGKAASGHNHDAAYAALGHAHTKADIGLGNVDNTADAAKAVLTATKWATARTITLGGDLTGNVSLDGSANVTLTGTVTGKEPTIAAGTTTQYWRGDKSWRDFATDVRATVLTGLSTASSAVVAATDTVLAAIGKLQAQISLKLDSASYTAADVLTKIKTVDGSGSGLDADTLDGMEPSALPISTATQTALNGKLDATGYTAADVLAKIATVDGAGSGLDADTVDGLQGGVLARTDAVPVFAGAYVGGVAGGRIELIQPGADTALAGNVAINAYGNLLRVFEAGGTARGLTVDLTQCAAGVGSVLPMTHLANTWTAKQTINSDLEFGAGALRKIIGDFSSAATARTIFQTSVANSTTAIPVVPNGTSTTASIQLLNASDLSNYGVGIVRMTATSLDILTSAIGTGTTLPIKMGAGATPDDFTITTGGNVEHTNYTKLGESSPAIKLKQLTATSPASEGGSVNIAHGLADYTKIRDVSVVIHTGTYAVTQGMTIPLEHQFNVVTGTTYVTVYLHATNSGNLLSKTVTVLITYEE